MKPPIVVFFEKLSAQSCLRQILRLDSSSQVLLNADFHLLCAASVEGWKPQTLETRSVNQTMPDTEQACLRWIEKNTPQNQDGAILLLPAVFALQSKAILREFFSALQNLSGFHRLKDESIFAIGPIRNATTPAGDFVTEICSLNAPRGQFEFSLLATPTRAFNHIAVGQSLIYKDCEDAQKGEDEWRFLRSVPAPLLNYFPRVFHGRQNGTHFEYEIEKIPMFDLSRYYLHRTLNESEWQEVFELLRQYLQSVPRQTVTNNDYQRALRTLTIDKLQQRTARFLSSAHEVTQRFEQRTGRPFKLRVEHLVARLEQKIAEGVSTTLHYAHGDLVFSNILFESQGRTLKLVDPRGRFTSAEPFAPQEYDLAKICQSALDGYDWISADRTPDPNDTRSVEQACTEFLKSFCVDATLVYLIEASLLWSLLPLHRNINDKIFRFMLAGERAFNRAAA